MTEATPMMIPNIVKKERNFAAIKFLYEIFIGSDNSIFSF